MSVVCVFPGQGSQRKGMGAELFARHPDLCAAADEILGYSVRDLCLADPQRNLKMTAYTQPALFVVNALTWLERSEREPPPSFLAGHSLGEYSALFAAGCFDFETGLRMVQRRGALMAEVRDGGMAAVLGLDAAQVGEVLRREGAAVDIANFNLPDQTVLSGPKEDLERLIAPMEAAGARKCILLNVSGAFHSRYMNAAAEQLQSFLAGFQFSAPQIEVVANCTAEPYTVDSIVRLLTEQVRSSVRWAQTLEYLCVRGVTELEELGPGTVLQKLWKNFPKTSISPPSSEEKPAAAAVALSPAADLPRAQALGDPGFRQDYGLRYAYVASAPAGVRTPEMVAALGKQGCLSFLDLDGLDRRDAVQAVRSVSQALGSDAGFGVCLRASSADVASGARREDDLKVDWMLEEGVRAAEAIGYRRVAAALVRFRFRGARRDVGAVRRLLVQVGRVAEAELFLRPASAQIVDELTARGELTAEEAEVARRLPVCSDLCLVAEPAEGTETLVLLSAVRRSRDKLFASNATERPRVGAGGFGTPESVAGAFLLGADFAQTNAVNMGVVEAATPSSVKALLAKLDFGDTAVVPSLDGFLIGSRGQAVKKGSLFVPRARKLEQMLHFYDSLEAVDASWRKKLEDVYFKRSLESVWESLRAESVSGDEPKRKMALIFSWYLRRSLRWALDGVETEKLNYQIPCDESVAAFNHYAAGTALADPAARGAGVVAEALMRDAAAFAA